MLPKPAAATLPHFRSEGNLLGDEATPGQHLNRKEVSSDTKNVNGSHVYLSTREFVTPSFYAPMRDSDAPPPE